MKTLAFVLLGLVGGVIASLHSSPVQAVDGTSSTAAAVEAVIKGRATVDQLVLAAGAACHCAPPAAAAPAALAGGPSIDVGSATGAPGQQVTFAVTLNAAGALVAGAQNDLTFDAVNTPIAATAAGRPDCAVNPAINKEATAFAFRPSGCTGTACTGIRALVLSSINVDPIADGSVLYTCKVDIAPTASAGTYPLTISLVIMSDPSGNQVPGATGSDGAVIVGGGQCVGDCDGDGVVTAQEVATCQDIELGNLPLSACLACDANGDGVVAANEVAAAQQNSIDGCPPPPPTPTPAPPPPPVASFFFFPFDPSIFDTIQFIDSSFDPAQVGFQSFTWAFGDGATGTGSSLTHQYAADGDYTVQDTVTTFDGRSASTSQVVHVQTHDVAITKFSAPQAAHAGQTRSISVGINSKRYPENVQVSLYKSIAGFGGFAFVGSLNQFVPVRSANRTTPFDFSYTFTSDDAAIGKVTFEAMADILGARDALPADNTAISSPTKVSR